MADVSVKMGVSGISQFKQGMKDAQSSVKTLNEALKLNENQLKLNGDREQYMQNKTALLKKAIAEQTNVVKQGANALQVMRENGVDPASKAFQDMERSVYKAQNELVTMQVELQEVGNESLDAAGKTDQLANSLGGLNKKVSLEQVIGGIGKITDGMDKAIKKAAELGKAIWENITDAARFGDDTATQAMILNMDVEEYQKYKKVFDTVADLTVQEWQKAKLKVQKAIYDPTDDQTNILSLLGISTHNIRQGKYGPVQDGVRAYEEVFWEIGETLRQKVASGKITQDLADTYANAIFGKSFANLNPIFALGREGFQEALEEQNVVTEESVNKLAELNDQLIKLQGDFGTLKEEVLAGLAPALTNAAKTLDSLLGRLIEYLQTDEGKQALQDMGEAVEGLFSDLSKIDPEQVVEGFAGVFDKIVGGLQWLKDNKGLVIGSMEGILIGWGALKLTGGALTLLKLIDGIKGLTMTGAADGAAAGAAWGGAFANAVLAAAPWLAGLYTMLNPAETGNNDLFANGQLTPEGWADVYENPDSWIHETALEVGELFGELGNILNDANAINAMARYRNGGTLEAMIAELQALGYVLKVAEEMPVAETSGGGTLGKAEGPIIHKRRGGDQVIEFMEDEGPLMVIDPVLSEDTTERVQAIVEDMDWPIETLEPTLPENAAEILQEQANQITLTVGVNPHLNPGSWGGGVGGGGGGKYSTLMTHANGIWSVPFDGYAALLHKGERVVPAREVASRSFSSNMYIESMYMNNGQDADGLAARVAAENERIMSGFGN